MTLEEENKQLREALRFATNAIAYIVVCMVHESSHFPQIEKVLAHIDKLTPKPLP